jgi:tetratricopeptide (TPR) repeat protein
MINRIRVFLGTARLQALFVLLAVTGLGNLILNAYVDESEWVRSAQTLLVLAFIIGLTVITGSKLDAFERGRWLGLLAPAFGALVLSIVVIPDMLPVVIGLSLGWVAAGMFLLKPRGPMQYQQAIKYLRKNRYAEAVKAMDNLIKTEPDNANHYRFRAEVLRIWGRLDRARRDYQQMTQLEPDSAVAHNGLAEVELQARNYEAAHAAALKAYELAPGEWVAAYNLGMIEDRMKHSAAAIEHLNAALRAKVPDVRHRVLIHLYRARAYARMGDFDAARAAVEMLKKQRKGLDEWQPILNSDQAETLRTVLEADIHTAEALVNNQLEIEALA